MTESNIEEDYLGLLAQDDASKIVAVPSDALAAGGIRYAADGTEIGPAIWGSFAIVQEVESGAGATYVSPAGQSIFLRNVSPNGIPKKKWG